MATLIRSVRNETSNPITIKVPGFNPSGPVVLQPNVIVDMLKLVSEDELEALQPVLVGLVAGGDATTQATIEDTVLHIAEGEIAADLTILQGDVATAQTDISTLQGEAHTHSNKSLLDTYTQTEVDLETAVTQAHDGTLQALRTDAITTIDSVVTIIADGTAGTTEATADASVQTGAYVQVDVESIRTLTNSLKTNYNDLQTKYDAVKDLANDLKVKYNAAVTLINELKSKVDTMNA